MVTTPDYDDEVDDDGEANYCCALSPLC